MTYDPSMTITSTIPAPEGSDSTSREGKAIPLPVMAGGNASPAPDVPPPDMVKTVGGTTFDIYFHFSQSSRETLINAAIAAVDDDMAFCDVLRQCIEKKDT